MLPNCLKDLDPQRRIPNNKSVFVNLLQPDDLKCSQLCLLYESSGYEYTSSPQTYTSYRQVYTSSPQVNTTSAQNSLFKSNLSYNSEPENQPNGSQNPDSSIESGPSFNESLQRFKTASGHNSQMANWKSQMSSRTQSSHVQRRVEETRTMITQSSQKSYHIE